MLRNALILVITLCASFASSSVLARGLQEVSSPDAPLAVLAGRVLDASGAPIAGATVSVTVGGAGAPVTTTSSERGEFRVSVPFGAHTITVNARGFEVNSQSITTAGTSGKVFDIVLEVAGFLETVNVGGTSGYRVGTISAATRTPTPLVDIPQSISVVSRELMADQRMTSMADVIRYMPGVGIAQGEGNRDTPILRGNASTADFFVDGIRDDVQYFRDVYKVDRVEAVKGPNAMIFGRGGGGGVINRVTRQADWGLAREVGVQLGSHDNRRLTADLGRGLHDAIAGRVTGVYENSDSYRGGVELERYGINPTAAFKLGEETTLRAGYEYFHDARTADRGISSFQGRPVDTQPSTFFGDPRQSTSRATVNFLSSALEHRIRPGMVLRNRFGYADYDKFYQNVFPGATNATGTTVSISAYNNATQRQNLFNQTDLIATGRTGAIAHTMMVGVELGRQETDNFRATGYFVSIGPDVTSVQAPLAEPTISLPLAFRQAATDAANHGVATTVAVYAQDQVVLSRHLQAVGGVRLDRFDVDFRNNRTSADFASDDTLLSPRVGLIYKPAVDVSVYGSYSLSYLPRAGEQLGSLSLTNQALDPEEFTNYEVGVKWELAQAAAFTAAVYRLDRDNVAVPDPGDPTRTLLVDAQRTKGFEVEVTGRLFQPWSVTGGYAYQDGEITQSISAAAQAGASLAQLPEHSFSFWNRYDFAPRWGAALGVVRRGESFTSTDNLVVLPSYTRVDGAVFFTLSSKLRAQLNLENLFDEKYYPNAHSNTNITPGAPRAAWLAITASF